MTSTTEAIGVEQIAGWLRIFHPTDTPIELRAIRTGGQIRSGFFDSVDKLAQAAFDLQSWAKGIYFVANPIKTMPSGRRVDNSIRDGGNCAHDTDITERHWLLIDADPIRAANISATDAEREVAFEAMGKAVAWLEANGFAGAVRGDSGNGAHACYPIRLPNDLGSKELVEEFLRGLQKRFNSPAVHFDRTVGNASRIWKLYGTLAAKGENTSERPHRYSRLLTDEAPDPTIDNAAPLRAIVSCWKAEDAADNDTAANQPEPGRTAFTRAASGGNPYAAKALENQLVRVRTAPAGQLHYTLRSAACSLGRFAPAYLSEEEIERLLSEAAEAAGAKDMINAKKTIASGIKIGKANPRVVPAFNPPNRNGKHEPAPARQQTNQLPQAREADDDPHRLARLFIRERCEHADGLTLRYWRGEFHRWDESAYRPVSDKEIKAELTESVKAEMDRLNLIALEKLETNPKPTKVELKEAFARKVTGRLIADVTNALTSLTVLPGQFEAPAWIDQDEPFPVSELLACRNGLIRLPAFIARSDYLRAPTPLFFSSTALEIDFNPQASKPVAWLAFLNQLWRDDPQSIGTLQEWFGYLLTPDTRQQKILMLVGPKRSGKGTIARILRGLVGAENMAGPTLSGLAMNFGLSPLLGKTVAVISDARLSGRTDAAVVTERLLSISGEDAITIDRKNLSAITAKLSARFVILSNELPRLGDSSGALASRMTLLRLTESFYGREDEHLTDILLPELPGILLWAIEGWQRLQKRRRFSQPDAGKELLDELDDLSSPVGAFVREICVVGPARREATSDLFAAWKTWCQDNGRKEPGTEATFGRDLRAAVPTIKRMQAGSGTARYRVYEGISLKITIKQANSERSRIPD